MNDGSTQLRQVPKPQMPKIEPRRWRRCETGQGIHLHFLRPSVHRAGESRSGRKGAIIEKEGSGKALSAHATREQAGEQKHNKTGHLGYTV